MPSCSRANSQVERVEPEIVNNVNVVENERIVVAAEVIERPDVERCATLPRSSPNFRLDLSPNLNRPNHIYERLEEPSTSSSSAPTHWRFKMFKSVTKNAKQSSLRDGSIKQPKNSSNSEYDCPKAPIKLTDKCFPTKAKNKLKISPIASNGESSNQVSGSPISLNICFGKKSLHSPSNSQTLEFNDRSREGRDSNRIAERQVEDNSNATGVACQPQASALSNCVYGRVGNTYGRLHVLGSGIGRIERHLSSSCGNIDHYCTPHARHEGNPRFRIENQTVEADRTYQNPDNVAEEGDRIGASLVPADIRGISKTSLQWLMANRWLPLWVGNTGGKNEYKVIDLDFSLYDDGQYSACTSACTDEHCHGRNVFETCSLYRRTCSRAGRVCNYYGEQEHPPEEVNNHNVPVDDNVRDSSSRNSPENSFNMPNEGQNDSVEERQGNLSQNEDFDSPDTSQANNYVTQDSITDNDQGLSIGDNEPSTSEGRGMGQHSNSVDTCSPSSPSTPTPTAPPTSP